MEKKLLTGLIILSIIIAAISLTLVLSNKTIDNDMPVIESGIPVIESIIITPENPTATDIITITATIKNQKQIDRPISYNDISYTEIIGARINYFKFGSVGGVGSIPLNYISGNNYSISFDLFDDNSLLYFFITGYNDTGYEVKSDWITVLIGEEVNTPWDIQINNIRIEPETPSLETGYQAYASIDSDIDITNVEFCYLYGASESGSGSGTMRFQDNEYVFYEYSNDLEMYSNELPIKCWIVIKNSNNQYYFSEKSTFTVYP